MKTLIILAILGFGAYVGYSDWNRLKKQFDLETDVKKILATVPWNANGLTPLQGQQLTQAFKQRGFVLQPTSVRFVTAVSGDRPFDDVTNRNLFTEHVLKYTYARPGTFLPFRLELHDARTTKLVEIPNSAPTLPGMP